MRGTALGALLRGDRGRSAVRVTSMRTWSTRNRQAAEDLELPAAFMVLQPDSPEVTPCRLMWRESEQRLCMRHRLACSWIRLPFRRLFIVATTAQQRSAGSRQLHGCAATAR
jgi:hypothetical protein